MALVFPRVKKNVKNVLLSDNIVTDKMFCDLIFDRLLSHLRKKISLIKSKLNAFSSVKTYSYLSNKRSPTIFLFGKKFQALRSY